MLYDNKLYSRALYHLQQGNEKLAKGLLIAIGMMTPKQAKGDWATKALLGFFPREPKDYRHRTVQSFLSDISKVIPSLDDWLKHLETGEFGPKISEFRKSVRKSKERVRTLQKRGIPVVPTFEGLGNEIKSAEELLGNVGKAMTASSADLKFDFGKATEAAIKSTRRLGLKFDASELPSFSPLKDSFIPTLRLSVIGTLSLAFTAILDPLESVTRYPDSNHSKFDESDPYVMQFEGLHRVVTRLLEAGKAALASA